VDGDADAVDMLMAYVGYCFEHKGNKLSTINVKLAAVAYYHKIKFGVDLPMNHYWLSATKKGIERSQGGSTDKVTQTRWPLQWHHLTAGRQHCEEYKYDRRMRHLQVIWAGLALSYLLLARTSELFADDKSKQVHKEFGLLRSDLAFYDTQGKQLPWHSRALAVLVEIRFRGSKADQQRRGAVVQRTGPTLDILLQLLDLDNSISYTAPLMAYSEVTNINNTSSTDIKTVTHRLATSFLRHMLSALGESVNASKYTLHSGRIGGATALAATGAADSAIMAAGRWKSDAYKAYTRPTCEEAATISAALTSNTTIQRRPGEGTIWS
jgi:hypothetical protein